MPYFANIKQRGPLKFRDVPGSIDVLEALDQPMPIGQADCITYDANDNAVRKLSIGGLSIEGRWVIVDPEFRLAG